MTPLALSISSIGAAPARTAAASTPNDPDGGAGDDDERRWADAIRAGDAGAFAALFRAYYGPLCTYAKRYVGERETAEELVQDVMLKLWEFRATWLLRGTLKSYLYTAVRNQALDVLKHERVARRWRERVVRDYSAVAGAHGAVAGADDEVKTAELAAAIEVHVAKLPERCRQAFVLRRQHHLSYAEIARVMGTSTKTVEVQIGLALKALRKGLADWTAPAAR